MNDYVIVAEIDGLRMILTEGSESRIDSEFKVYETLVKEHNGVLYKIKKSNIDTNNINAVDLEELKEDIVSFEDI